MTFFVVEYRKIRFKDKVTFAQEEKYLTYGMVLCLVTLAVLLSASRGVCQHQLSYVLVKSHPQVCTL